MAEYKVDEHLKEIAEKIISEHPSFSHLQNDCCRIVYQFCDGHRTSNGKVVYADTEKVKDKFKSFCPYDFIITFYDETKDLSEEVKERIMHHELLHVGFDEQDLKYWIVPHDIEDFKEVVDLWGTNWITG